MSSQARQRDPRLWDALLAQDKNRRDEIVRTIKALELDEWYAAELLSAIVHMPRHQRPLAGDALSLLGDPRFSSPYFLSEMIAVPAGHVIMGSHHYQQEQPVHVIKLSGFALSQTPVSQAAYAQFIGATRHRAPRGWKHRCPAQDALNAPVVWVSARDAEAYCAWLSGETGHHYRLPTEAEWVLAARGVDSIKEYPWGDRPPENHANIYDGRHIGRMCAVGLFPDGRGPYGHDDLSGNIWEWCSSQAWDYPYDPADGREDPNSPDARVMHGGSWRSRAFSARCTSRQGEPPNDSFEVVGFRIARTSE